MEMKLSQFLRLWGLIMVLSVFYSCTNVNTNRDKASAFQEPYRPQFHFTPPSQWMNDPNGLVYHQGVYHLFYQHYPDSTVWGPMHWGHAVSSDLIKWQHKPIALYPDELGLIFSGSAVVDVANSSGFGTSENPPLVAIFTYHLMDGEQAGRKDFQTQGIAYSLDNGERWFKYEGNPVIQNNDIKDFRDPKVFWHEPTQQWILTLVAGDHAKFYKSTNLKDWTLLSEFGKTQGAHGGVWECPDLFELPVAGSQEKKWVLLISMNPGAPNGGSGTQYFVGDFDGTSFTTDQTNARWIDQGRDNYAGVTFNNMPNDERVFIGWMSNWDYARTTPTEVWRSAMTLPRSISLHQDSIGFYIKNYPVSQLSSITSVTFEEKAVLLTEPFELAQDNFNQSELRFDMLLSEPLKLTLSNDLGEQVVLEMDPERRMLRFDRTQSGLVDFDQKFALGVQKQSYHNANELAELRIIMDASSIEIFIDKGRYVFTNQIFPTTPYTRITLTGNPSTVLKDFKINKLTSIWHHE